MDSMNAFLSPVYLTFAGPFNDFEASTRSDLRAERQRANTDSPEKWGKVTRQQQSISNNYISNFKRLSLTYILRNKRGQDRTRSNKFGDF